MPDLMEKFHEASPYDGHDLAAHPPDMQGWGSDDPVFEHLITALRPGIIVEVGSWKGASAIHMGRIVRKLQLGTRIICVDTWLGSPEHFLGDQKAWRDSLRFRNGYPQLYFTFLTNVIVSELTDVIIPLPTTSENAAVILSKRGISADLIYIDAGHEYETVLGDLRRYWPLLSDRGILLGDDYMTTWPGVTQAAKAFAVSKPGTFFFGRPGKFGFSRHSLP